MKVESDNPSNSDIAVAPFNEEDVKFRWTLVTDSPDYPWKIQLFIFLNIVAINFILFFILDKFLHDKFLSKLFHRF